jgi:uncharacterized protein DUF3892
VIEVIAVRMAGPESLRNITEFRWVEVDAPGGAPTGPAHENSREEMVAFVCLNPGQAFAESAVDGGYVYLIASGRGPTHVRTCPDSMLRDNLLSLPRF